MRDYITDEEFKLIIEKINPKFQKVALLAMETGMRLQEIITLNPNNINFDNQTVRLTNTKFQQDHDVYLNNAAIRIIKSINYDNQLFNIDYHSVLADFSKASKSLGLNDVAFHHIRSSAAYKLAKTMKIEELATQFGHGHFYSYAHLNKYYD